MSVRRLPRRFAAAIALATALCISTGGSAQISNPQTEALHRNALQLHNESNRRVVEFGPEAGWPSYFEALDATRAWLRSRGALTPERNAAIDRLSELCGENRAGRSCDRHEIILNQMELGLLLSIDAEGSATFSAMSQSIVATRARLDGDWTTAERNFIAASETLGRVERPTPSQSRLHLSYQAAAANAAYMEGHCGVAVGLADRILARLAQEPQLHPDEAQDVTALTLKASCSLLFGRIEEAYQLAQTAIAAQSRGRPAYDHSESFDLRARFLSQSWGGSDPRDVGATSALLLAQNLPASDGQHPRYRELFEQIVRWTSERRASTMADAIQMTPFRRGISSEHRAALVAVIEANAAMESARVAAYARAPEADQQMRAAIAQLPTAESGARALGVALPSHAVSSRQIYEALEPNEGFLFFHTSEFGPIVWGLTGRGSAILVPPTLRTQLMTSRVQATSLAPDWSNDASLRLMPPKLLIGREAPGVMLRDANAALSSNRRLPHDLQESLRNLVRDYLDRLGADIGMFLAGLEGEADLWAISYGDEFDGLPISQIPLAPIVRQSNGTWSLERTLGSQFAYAIAPSPAAFVAMRAARPPRSASATSFIGVGDIPFYGRPCVSAENSARAPATSSDYGRVRDQILGHACLSESARHLQVLGESTAGERRLLTGEQASEGNLRAYRGREVGVIAFSTHGLASGEPLSFGRPGLLLYPPVREEGRLNDGRLLAQEVGDLGIVAELVILTACSTGIGDQFLGEEPLAGMARGFFLGGARSVLIARWDVQGSDALRFNDAFARALRRGETRAAAMRSARRAMIEGGSATPWGWATFELIGEGGSLAR